MDNNFEQNIDSTIDDVVDGVKKSLNTIGKVTDIALFAHDAAAYLGTFVVVSGTIRKLCPYKGILPTIGRLATAHAAAITVTNKVELYASWKEFKNGGKTNAGDDNIIDAEGKFSDTGAGEEDL